MPYSITIKLYFCRNHNKSINIRLVVCLWEGVHPSICDYGNIVWHWQNEDGRLSGVYREFIHY